MQRKVLEVKSWPRGDPRCAQRSGWDSCPFSLPVSMWIVIPRGHPASLSPHPPKMKPEQKGLTVSVGTPTPAWSARFRLYAMHPWSGDHRATCLALLEWYSSALGAHVVVRTPRGPWLLERVQSSQAMPQGVTCKGRDPAACGVLSSQNLALPLLCAAGVSQK